MGSQKRRPVDCCRPREDRGEMCVQAKKSEKRGEALGLLVEVAEKGGGENNEWVIRGRRRNKEKGRGREKTREINWKRFAGEWPHVGCWLGRGQGSKGRLMWEGDIA